MSTAALNGRLAPEHLADLRKSGLTDETIHRAGLHTVRNADEIRHLLRWRNYTGSLGPCLLIPYCSADGQVTDYARLKPTKPRKGKDKDADKVIKYEAPKGVPNRAYFPPGCTLEALRDPTRPLLIVEGEKKALRADQEGFACVGVAGVYAWQQKREHDADGKAIGERQLIPDLYSLEWAGRVVTIIFDSDAVRNLHVRWAEFHLARALAARGAVVRVVRLPDDGKVKVGLDDYLMTHSAAELQQLLETATEPEAPSLWSRHSGSGSGDPEPENPEKTVAPSASKPIEADNDPHRLARLYRDTNRADNILTLRYWQEEWFRWEEAAYRRLQDKEVRAELVECIKAEFDRLNVATVEEWKAGSQDKPPPVALKVTTRLTADVLQALGSLTLLPSRVQAPAWLDGAGPWPADEMLACRNQLVHLPSFAEGKPFSLPLTPRFFSSNALDYDFLPDAPRPAHWLRFLKELWGEDQHAVQTLQEWFGYSLLPDTTQQKILLIVGPKRSGKGTIARILRALVGIDNTCGPTLGGLGVNFGLQPLLGKTLAIISDARLSGRTDAAIVTERLLSISGEDAQTIDRKHMQHVTCQLPVRFVILTNELPRLSDPSGALVGRMVVLRLMDSWYGKEDTELTARLQGELPGILLWAVEGWRRLRERGRFLQPESSRRLIDDLEDLSSPIGAFIRERCEVGPGLGILVRDLFAAWKSWCEDKGRKDPGTEQTLGRDLRAAVPTLDVRQPRMDRGRVRVYEGIRLRQEGDGFPQ